jgi:tetratricopeptide (TPR) repeat protein
MPPPVFDSGTAVTVHAALARARGGDLQGARQVAERALAAGGEEAVLRPLLGMLCCQSGDLESGIAHLKLARDRDPADAAVAGNLAMALLESGRPDEALEVAAESAAASDRSGRLWRIRAYLLQLREEHEGAVEAYRNVVEDAPDDFESWNNLGNSYAALERFDQSLEALGRAVALQPQVAPVRINFAATLIAAGRLDEAVEALQGCVRDFPRDPKPLVELGGVLKQLGRDAEALDVLERAVRLDPRDADLQVKLATERLVAWKMEEAEQALRAAIAVSPSHADAHVMLAIVLEHLNRAGDFEGLIDDARRKGVEEGAIRFIHALACRRERRYREGLEALAGVPSDIEPIRRAQLAGQFHDGLGEVSEAFAAFSDMNRLQAEDSTDPLRRAAELRAGLERDQALVTAAWYHGWRPATAPSRRPSPAFLVGFPRSGTTLLDTLLMGHPDVQVLEERPPLYNVEQALGGLDRLPELGDAELEAMRERYFAEVSEHVALRPGALLVDKSPLHMNKVPLIHRLFPDARFILALRHPCDVVLSCFITNFRLNSAMANFLRLEDAAAFYDLSFRYWSASRSVLPIRVHEVAYERMVEDPEAALRPLFDFLDLPWHSEALDHQRTAHNRGVISTASYAQVTEPIYRRAAGRWHRYRRHLEPVLPTLLGWSERLGYTAGYSFPIRLRSGTKAG